MRFTISGFTALQSTNARGSALVVLALEPELLGAADLLRKGECFAWGDDA
jgi:hypothetical protein